MTARHQLRIGRGRLSRDRAAIDATPAPPIGETLLVARERKGVDLYRAERDTKIRLRYLSALEDGAYDELPPPVYTKGFLRNYAIYLGLDPDEILERWRDEMDALRASERLSVAPPPQPIAAPGRQITITPGMFVAGLAVLAVLAFVGYVALQLLRYVEVTPVELTQPSNVFSTIDADTTVLEGTSGPGALITIVTPTEDLVNTNANEEGEWSYEVTLARGRNDFTITATDPVTQRESPRLVITITRPLPSHTAIPSASLAPVPTLSISLAEPVDGAVSTDGNVIVRGTTSGSRVTIESEYVGQPGVSPLPTPEGSPGAPLPSAVTTPSPAPPEVPIASPPASGAPPPPGSPGPAGPARDVTVPDSGEFTETLTFSPGSWRLTITAFDIGAAPVSEVRTISVQPPVTTGVQLVIAVQGRASWVRITADGERVPGFGGRTLKSGETHTVTAVNELCLRTGNAGSLALTLNGLDVGLLGRSGEVGSWIFRAGQAPQRIESSC